MRRRSPRSCDGTLIAVHYNDVSRQELLDVKQQIEQTGYPILGTVLNQVDYDNYMGRKYYKSYQSMENTVITESIINGATKRKRNERLYGLSCALRLRRGRWCAAREKKCLPCWMQRQQTVCGTCLLPRTVRRAWNASRRKSIAASGAGPRILHTKRLRPEAGARL